MFSLDLTSGILVEFPKDEQDFEKFLKEFQEKYLDSDNTQIIF